MSIVLFLLGVTSVYVSQQEKIEDKNKTNFYVFVAFVLIAYVVFGIIF